jgi:hypothetical protein
MCFMKLAITRPEDLIFVQAPQPVVDVVAEILPTIPAEKFLPAEY